MSSWFACTQHIMFDKMHVKKHTIFKAVQLHTTCNNSRTNTPTSFCVVIADSFHQHSPPGSSTPVSFHKNCCLNGFQTSIFCVVIVESFTSNLRPCIKLVESPAKINDKLEITQSEVVVNNNGDIHLPKLNVFH